MMKQTHRAEKRVAGELMMLLELAFFITLCAITTFPTTDDLCACLAWNSAMLCALGPSDLPISALFFLLNKMHTLRAWIIALYLPPCSWGTCEWVGRGRHWVGQWLICIFKVSHILNETNVLSHGHIYEYFNVKRTSGFDKQRTVFMGWVICIRLFKKTNQNLNVTC